MTIEKWTSNNSNGIIIGALISLLISLNLHFLLKVLLGGLAGGYIYSMLKSGNSHGKNYGIWPAIPWLISGGIALLGIIPMFQKQPPTLSEQLSEIPMWIWFVGGFFLLLIVKSLRKKPRTIIIQNQ